MASAYEEIIRLTAKDETQQGVRSAEGRFKALHTIARIPLSIIDKATAPLRGIMNMLSRIGLAADGIRVGAQMAQSLAQPLRLAGDLQQQVANISTIMPDLDSSRVFTALNEMQRRVPQSAAQLGASLYDVFSSVTNITTEEGLALVEKFGRGATGAQTDAQTFGTAIMGVMNAYKLEVSDADHISDVFFNTVKAGVVTGSELAGNLGLVTQSAKMAGSSMDELGAMIVGVTKEGGPAAQNINNLNNLLLKITTSEAQTALHTLGITTTDATGAFRSQVDVLSELNDKTKDLSDSARTSALQDIFPDLQARAGATVIMSQIAAVKAALDENKNGSGAAAQAFEKMVATYNNQMVILHNTVDSIFTTLGAEILPHITPLLSMLSEKLPGAIGILGSVWRAFTYDAGAMGQALDGVGESFGETAKTGIQPFFQWIMETIPKVQALWGVITTQFIPALGRLWNWLSPMLGVAFGWLINTGWPMLQTAFGAISQFVMTEVVPRLQRLYDWLMPRIEVAIQWWQNTAWPTLQTTLGAISSFIEVEVVPKLVAVWEWLFPLMTEAINWWSTTAWPGLQATWTSLSSFIETEVVPKLVAIYNWVYPKLKEAIDWAVGTGWPSFQKSFLEVTEVLGDKKATEAMGGMAQSFGNLRTSVDGLDVIMNDLKVAWQDLNELFASDSTGVQSDALKLLIDVALLPFRIALDSAAASIRAVIFVIGLGTTQLRWMMDRLVDIKNLLPTVEGAFKLFGANIQAALALVDAALWPIKNLIGDIVKLLSGGFGALPDIPGIPKNAPGPAPTPPAPFSASNLPPIANASGGWLREPILGMGLDTGRRYSFVENRKPEYVVPAGSTGNVPGGARTSIVLQVAPGAVQISGADGPAQSWADAAEDLWADLYRRLDMAMKNQASATV